MKKIIENLLSLVESQDSNKAKGSVMISFATQAACNVVTAAGHGDTPESLQYCRDMLVQTKQRKFADSNGNPLPRFNGCCETTLVFRYLPSPFLGYDEQQAATMEADKDSANIFEELAFGLGGDEFFNPVVLQIAENLAGEDTVPYVSSFCLYDFAIKRTIGFLHDQANIIWPRHQYSDEAFAAAIQKAAEATLNEMEFGGVLRGNPQ